MACISNQIALFYVDAMACPSANYDAGVAIRYS